MSKMMKTAGFYGTDTDTFYVTPSGRIWIVASEDDLGTQDPVEIQELPDNAEPVGELMTVDESIEACKRIESVSGEKLIEYFDE